MSFSRFRLHRLSVGLLVLLAGCSPAGDIRTCSKVVGTTVVTAVLEGGQLEYAFVRHVETPAVSSNDPSIEPCEVGIHFCYEVDRGLWFDGEPVEFPSGHRIFAITREGSVVPIELDEAQLTALTGALLDEKADLSGEKELRDRLLAPHATVTPAPPAPAPAG